MAQRDLKLDLCIDLNKVDEYANFASTIPGGANFDVNERDSLTYVAAERYICGVRSPRPATALPVIYRLSPRCFQSECQLLYRFDRL